MAHLETGGQPESHAAAPGDPLPRHDDFDAVTRAIELLSLLAASLLLAWQLLRLGQHGALTAWWSLPAALLAVLAADFISGLVHWFADTWFDESVPVLGPRFLRPFRVHHVNPETFLTRDFVDTNGDVAMLTIPFLLAVFAMPLELAWGQAAGLFLVALSAAAMPTNQVHQWAHMPRPPRWVAWLQRWGLILSVDAHRRHHEPPHVANYCIATGWCNPGLSAVKFFPRLERLITWLTGLQPRQDDQRYLERFASAAEERA